MNRKRLLQVILYILCLYDIYLYLPDILDLFGVNFFAPTADFLMYFDAVMLLIGGVVIGIMLMKSGGKFNRYLAITMIISNVVLTPWFLFKALL